ncbi:hypothetical protein FHS27_006382 [Rhodopirellula rubra]|uniref:Uncharacterized protein n=1 Tax=Aporhodopirellula rubra TaxID=980271 RepID=A0A7W5H9U7_9BACT|nr:hypothetical protein [Aporhodopirellula rubra]MBB3210535.1 hypothetical protein [Aporhodopirellula rubra]
MNEELHYYVDLCGDLRRPESIEEPSGDELAAILADGLPKHGVAVLKNEGVDFSHYLDCDVDGSTVELMVGAEVLDDTNNRWYIQPCAKRNFFGRETVPDATYRTVLLAVDAVIRSSPRISDVRWFPCFDTPEYLTLMPGANSPIRAPDYADNAHPLIRAYWNLNAITNICLHPVFMVSFFLLTIVLVGTFPNVGPAIITVLFFSILALMTVVPFVLSIFVGRAAKRSASGG